MSLLERSLDPQFNTGGLTAGVDYFGRVGQGQRRTMNPGPASPRTAEAEVPQGTGFGGGSGDPGLAPAGPGQRMTGEQAFNTQMGLAGVGLLGAATNNPELQQVAGLGGVGVAASQGNYAPLASTATRMLGGTADAANAVNLATQAYQSYANRATPERTELDPEGRFLGSTGSIQNANRDASLATSLGSTVAGRAIPGYNLADLGLRAATGFFGDTPTSIGDIVSFAPRGLDNFPGASTLNAAQGQKVVQYAEDPVAVVAALRGVNQPENPLAMEEARKANAFARDTGWNEARPAALQAQFDAGQQRVGGMGLDAGTFGMAEPTGGYNSWAQDDAIDAGGGSSGDSGGGNGGGMSDSYGSSSYGGEAYGSSPMGTYADGGMIGDMPGITQRYMDGGAVQGGPMLSMGYAEGGMMGAPQQGQLSGQPTPEAVNRQVSMMLKDPRAAQRLLARPMQLMQTGELTPEEVSTMGRVAEAALFSPELYPQLRQFVAAQGMTPLPPAFDPNVIVRIMAISRALQSQGQGQTQEATPPGQVPSTDQAQMVGPVPGAKNGGYLQGPGTGRSDSIGTVNESTGNPVKVANGEYVVPAHVVRAKGREFFDNLLRRYSDVPKGE